MTAKAKTVRDPVVSVVWESSGTSMRLSASAGGGANPPAAARDTGWFRRVATRRRPKEMLENGSLDGNISHGSSLDPLEPFKIKFENDGKSSWSKA